MSSSYQMKKILISFSLTFLALQLHAQVHSDSAKVNIIPFTPSGPSQTQQDNYRQSDRIFFAPTGSYFSISTDLLQYLVYQPNIGFEYRRKKFAWGINFGVVHPDPTFYVNPLADGQYTWPGTLYNGEALRAYWKVFFKNNPSSYFCVQAEYKYLWYNNGSFMDMPNGDEFQVNYTMNEKATALGIDVLLGKEWLAFKIMHFDIFYGIGYHVKYREFTVVTSNFPYPGDWMPLGSYKGSVSYPAPILGLKGGF